MMHSMTCRPTIIHHTHRRTGKLVVTLTALLAVGISARAEPPSVIISTSLGDTENSALAKLITTWSQMPTIDEVLVIRNKSDGEGKFGEIIALEFTSDDGYQAWVQNEQVKVPDEIRVRSANVLTHGEITPRDTSHAVFKVNDYDPSVSIEKYDAFADFYIRPLMEGQVAAKLMTRYTTYYELGDDGLVWSIYEYKSYNAIERAGIVKSAIRETLTETNTNYREFHLIKDGLRVGGDETYGSVVPFD